MATLVSVDEFRIWAGANVPSSVDDELIESCLAEAEAGIVAETGEPLAAIVADTLALDVLMGEEKRRANRLLARRNSPEGVAGLGEAGVISIPTRDADSQRAVWHIQAILLTPEGVA